MSRRSRDGGRETFRTHVPRRGGHWPPFFFCRIISRTDKTFPIPPCPAKRRVFATRLFVHKIKNNGVISKSAALRGRATIKGKKETIRALGGRAAG